MSLRESAAKGCELCVAINYALGGRDLKKNQENTGLWLEDYTRSSKYYYLGPSLRVYYGPVGNVMSPLGHIYFATDEGLKGRTTG
jgi:hypothetical protein